jgi:hypothetical protein
MGTDVVQSLPGDDGQVTDDPKEPIMLIHPDVLADLARQHRDDLIKDAGQRRTAQSTPGWRHVRWLWRAR